ncbi:MAG TPA: F0F1 ATP synthase subunit B [Candidatus Saccharimonadales bacterium]|nr:F0F1 ATP synthase subunit B [Candidatus Saccharimonadales bacterium]
MEIFKEFGVNWILLLAQIVNFTILLLLLKRFLYKPILKVLDERKAKVAQSLKDAEAIEKRMQDLTIEQQKILDQAKEEANKLIAEAKAEAKELSEKNMAETKKSVAAVLEQNEKRLKLDKEAMMSSAKADLAELVAEATAKVAKKSMTEKENMRLVEETIKEFS